MKTNINKKKQLKKDYQLAKHDLKVSLQHAKDQQNAHNIDAIKKELIKLKQKYHNAVKALKPVKKLTARKMLAIKYHELKKSLKASLKVAHERENQSDITLIKKQLVVAKNNYRNSLKALIPVKKLSPKQLLKQKFIKDKKQLKTQIVENKKQNNEIKVKQLTQQLQALKIKYQKEKALLVNKTPSDKQTQIHNFTIVSLSISITSLLILIIFALVGATNINPWFQIVITNGSLTTFGIVFILLLLLVVGLLISTLSFYILNNQIKKTK